MRACIVAVLVLTVAISAGCAEPPSPTATLTPASLPTSTITPKPSNIPIPTATQIVYPMQLEQVGQFGGRAVALALNNDTVYLGVAARVIAIDVHDPAQPAIIGRSNMLPGQVTLLDTYDHYLLVRLSDQPKQVVFDISAAEAFKPLEEREAAAVMNDSYHVTPNPSESAGYRFDFDELAMWDMSGKPPLSIRDASGEPVLTAIQSLPDGQVFAANTIAARDHYVFVANGFGLLIYDLSIPPRMVSEEREWVDWQVTSRLVTDDGTPDYQCCFPLFFTEPPSLCVIGEVLYTESGRLPWDLTQPDDPQPSPQTAATDCDAYPIRDGLIRHWMNIYGRYYFVDQRDPANPEQHEIDSGAGEGQIAAVRGDRLYYFEHTQNHDGSENTLLQIFNITDPRQPVRMGSIVPVSGADNASWTPTKEQEYPWFVVIDHYLYADFTGGTEASRHMVFDVADPSAPKEVEAPNAALFNSALLVSDGLVYAADHDGLQIFDETDLSHPLGSAKYWLGRTRTEQPIRCGCIWKYGDRLYVSMSNGVAIFNVADPAQPQLLAVSGRRPASIAAYGDTVYFQLVDEGVGIFKLVPN
jgi:hypothetical protein